MKKIILSALIFFCANVFGQNSVPAKKKSEVTVETKKENVFRRNGKKIIKSKPAVKTKKAVIKTSHKVGHKLERVGDGK